MIARDWLFVGTDNYGHTAAMLFQHGGQLAAASVGPARLAPALQRQLPGEPLLQPLPPGDPPLQVRQH
jgi:hypothetical protein